MLKSLLGLLILALAPILLLLFVESYNPYMSYRNWVLREYFENDFRGTFYLLEAELQPYSAETWPTRIDELNTHFGYRIELTPLDQAIEHYNAPARITGNHFVFDDTESPPVLLKRVAESDWVLKMSLDENDYEEVYRSSNGTVFLIRRMLAGLPAAELPAAIERLSPHFGFDIELATPGSIAFTDAQREALQRDSFTWIDLDDDASVFYIDLGEGKPLLVAGPTGSPEKTALVVVTSFVIAVLLLASLALLLWLFPLWRDLRELDRSSARFGQGHLDTRVKLAKRSIASRLGASFNNMADGIQRLIHSQQQLTNAVAHDLRTPLARLRFAFEMLDANDGTEEELQRYRRNVHTSIDAMETLVNQLLVHARYSRVADQTQFSHAPLDALILEELEAYRDNPRGLQVEFSPGAAEAVRMDSRALRRALNNLLSNALKHAQKQIRVSTLQTAQECTLVVEDDGPGIAPPQRQQIFEPFTQLNNPVRSGSSGYGLGLAIVKQIAHWHGGEVSVTTSTLGGARFQLRWPVN